MEYDSCKLFGRMCLFIAIFSKSIKFKAYKLVWKDFHEYLSSSHDGVVYDYMPYG